MELKKTTYFINSTVEDSTRGKF